uniref:hypothetical protein n=1 Tax=Klebsiella pneumoniae TaxID=573 RepID=UPI003A5CC375
MPNPKNTKKTKSNIATSAQINQNHRPLGQMRHQGEPTSAPPAQKSGACNLLWIPAPMPLRIPVNLNSDSGICEHHFRKVCGQGFCEQKLSFEGRHLFDSPNKPAAKRSAAVVDPGHWSMTVHLTSEFVL